MLLCLMEELLMTLTILVVSAAFLGAALVWAMLTLLYWPVRPMRLGPLTLHGALYRAWPALASEASSLLCRELSGAALAERLLEAVDLEEELRLLLDKRLAGVIKGAAAGMPLVAAFVSDDLVENIKGQVMVHALQLVPEIKQTLSERVADQVDGAAIVKEKLNAVDVDTLEPLCRGIVRSRLGSAVAAGAAVGAFFGLLQVLLLSLFS